MRQSQLERSITWMLMMPTSCCCWSKLNISSVCTTILRAFQKNAWTFGSSRKYDGRHIRGLILLSFSGFTAAACVLIWSIDRHFHYRCQIKQKISSIVIANSSCCCRQVHCCHAVWDSQWPWVHLWCRLHWSLQGLKRPSEMLIERRQRVFPLSMHQSASSASIRGRRRPFWHIFS